METAVSKGGSEQIFSTGVRSLSSSNVLEEQAAVYQYASTKINSSK